MERSVSEFAVRRLVTIVAEAVLEDRLLRDLRSWGVTGLTVSRAEGDPFGSRVSDVAGAYLRVECVVSGVVADRVLERLRGAYLERFKLVAYDHPVRVVRGDKYA